MKAYDRDGGVLRRMDLKNSLYYNGFMEGYLYRTGCYTCPYATEKRVADLTLGDFWGHWGGNALSKCRRRTEKGSVPDFGPYR